MFYVQQTNNHDCGFTCLKILLANTHHDRDYLFLEDPFINHDNISFFDLVKEGNNYSISLEALKAEDKEELNKDVHVPFIARMLKDNTSHAVYVYRISNKYVYYYDPKGEFIKLMKGDFISLWSGELLLVKEYTKTKCPIKPMKLVKPVEYVITYLFEFISAITGVLGAYFISKDSYIYLPLIFFSLMIIFELVLKKYSLIVMSNMDKRIEELTDDIKEGKYYEFHSTYESYKKYSLLTDISMLSNIFIIILIAFIMILNDKKNAIYLSINILFAAAFILFIKPLLEKDEKDIEEAEELLKRDNDKYVALSNMSNARKLSYSFINKLTAYKCIVFAFQIITTFIMMILNHYVNVTYIICYLVMQMYFYNNLEEFLNKPKEKDKETNLLAKLINMMKKNSQ